MLQDTSSWPVEPPNAGRERENRRFHASPEYIMKHPVASLSGLDPFPSPTRHFRAGLLFVPSLRDYLVLSKPTQD